jgi:predicted flap endonuclease-1-like 5' DNA nuclease
MKISKQLKKTYMSDNKKTKKNLAKKIDKKIVNALEERYRKAKKEMKEAKNAHQMAKDFFEKNQADKKSKKKNKANKTKSTPKAKSVKQPKIKKTIAKKSTSKKPASNARVTTLSQLEPTTPEKNIKRLPKPLRIKKSKSAPKIKPTSKKKKITLPKKVAVKKIILKAVEPAPSEATPTPKPTEQPVAEKIITAPKPATKPVVKKATAAQPTITKTQMENLKVIEGVGPAIEKILKSNGIKTVADLSKTKIDVLRNILEEAGNRFRMHKPDTWARQAKLAAANKFDELKEWQKDLDGGKK